MERLIIAAALALLAVAVAYVVERRRAAVPLTVRQGEIPTRIDLASLDAPAEPAVVVFTEASCATCAGVLEVALGEASGGLQVYEVEYRANLAIHRAHDVDTVPTTVVTNADGTVVDGWIGAVTGDELRSAVDGLR